LLAAASGHKYHMAINAAASKKGGVNDLGKLRSVSGVILTFLFCSITIIPKMIAVMIAK
jgi:hypothetical protein